MMHDQSFTLRCGGSRRRLVNLELWPLLQLQLPLLLLATTAAFALLFLAHTNAAYGSLVDASLQQTWVRNLASEIQNDYNVVSASIITGYALAVLGICLARAHRLLGSIVALERHVQSLRTGDCSTRIHVRAGHPLTTIARDLNELAASLE